MQTVSQLYYLGERLSSDDLSTLKEETEELKCQVLGEKDQRAARQLEVCDLKAR